MKKLKHILLFALFICCGSANGYADAPTSDTSSRLIGFDMTGLSCQTYSGFLQQRSPFILPVMVWLHGLTTGLAIHEDGTLSRNLPNALDDNFIKGAMIHLETECKGTPDEKVWRAFLKTDKQ